MSEKKRGLPKPPLFTSDYIAMAEILEFALERFGQLVLALMRYTADGTEPDDLPPDIKAMFSIYRRKIDAAREKYDHVCAVHAESGSKGGKAKAEKSKQPAKKFKPPTLKQFREAANHFIESEDMPEGLDAYEVDSFFDELKDAGWTIGGTPIQTRADWENAIWAKFCKAEDLLPAHVYYSAFSLIFANCGKEKGGEFANNAALDFFDTFDESSKNWIVDGESFPAPQWREALARFIEQYSNA